MVPESDRRKHPRVDLTLDMVLEIHDEMHVCIIENVSEGGVLAKMITSAAEKIEYGDIGHCLIRGDKNEQRFPIIVFRQVNDEIALKFNQLNEQQMNFLKDLVKYHI